jgi:hypothetical protein
MDIEPITITDSLGTFQAENPDTIPATIRKRLKERERLETIQRDEFERARTIATVRAFHVLTMLREPNRAKRPVAILQKLNESPFPVREVAQERGAYSSFNVETADGSAVVSFHCMENIVSVVCDFNDFPWLLFTVDNYSESQTVRAYAIGIFQTSHCLVKIDNVSPSDFMEPQPATVSGF